MPVSPQTPSRSGSTPAQPMTRPLAFSSTQYFQGWVFSHSIVRAMRARASSALSVTLQSM